MIAHGLLAAAGGWRVLRGHSTVAQCGVDRQAANLAGHDVLVQRVRVPAAADLAARDPRARLCAAGRAASICGSSEGSERPARSGVAPGAQRVRLMEATQESRLRTRRIPRT